MSQLLWALMCVGLASCAVAPGASTATSTSASERQAWAQRAQGIDIVRDDWGIAHIRGRTDADAVFGMMFAQAEDDFNRIEFNYLDAMGRRAEAEGEAAIWRDLRMKLFIDPEDLKRQYAASPRWLRDLMDAWAGGLNHYLATHPQTRPRVITRFEPWMALSFSEGSIGGDIERVNLTQLEAFYAPTPQSSAAAAADLRAGGGSDDDDNVMPALVEPTGSNGIAIAPAHSASGHALLWINPHTSFFFRAEQQVTSDEGLNVYGASTWGQFFVYQGFNERAGWMHTSSGVDNIDEYQETVARQGPQWFYKYGQAQRPVQSQTLTVPYKTATGMASRSFTVYRTHHGPVVREAGGQWISVRLMNTPMQALMQSYARTKATSLKAFRAQLDLHSNSSNNTVYADADGNVAYFHANFIPKRNPKFNWTQPVDGSDPATEWGAPLSVDESPLVINPKSGFIQNTNNWPYSAAGKDSPKPSDFPAYVESGGENPRGIHALRLLEGQRNFTPESLMRTAFSRLQPEFELLMPRLLKAWDDTPGTNPLKAKLAGPIATLRPWDTRWAADSVPNALAVLWGEELWSRSRVEARTAGVSVYEFLETRTSAAQQLDALAAVVDRLTKDFGSWQTPWGEINRFQRISADITHPFDDREPSIPIPFTSARWGSLASFGAATFNGSKKQYGTSGNSFVAVVEFSSPLKARAVSAGGQSGNPKSPHFNDQALRYSGGNLREVYFYPEQLKGHTERRYHPGE